MYLSDMSICDSMYLMSFYRYVFKIIFKKLLSLGETSVRVIFLRSGFMD